MKDALAKANVTEGFMNAVSPGTVAVFQPNEYYPSHQAYMEALAAAMQEEYETIVKSGLLLQVDCPDLAMGRHSRFRNLSDEEFLRTAEIQVEALNHALANVPADRVRLHICWGNYEGPHTHDIPLEKVLPLLFKAKPMALLIEGANPRHEHEWEIWKTHNFRQTRSWFLACSTPAATLWSIPSWLRSASPDMPRTSAASGSLPVPIAASARSRASVRFTRPYAGSRCGPWPKARPWHPKSSGEPARPPVEAERRRGFEQALERLQGRGWRFSSRVLPCHSPSHSGTSATY